MMTMMMMEDTMMRNDLIAMMPLGFIHVGYACFNGGLVLQWEGKNERGLGHVTNPCVSGVGIQSHVKHEDCLLLVVSRMSMLEN